MAKNRSKGFPILSLSKCIYIIKEASKNGRNLANNELAAFGSKSTDKASSKSGAYFKRRAALKDFGLIELSKKDSIHITDLAWKIAYPQTEEEKKIAKITAFLKPDLFNQLYQKVQKNVELKKDANIGNRAIAEGVLPIIKDKFIASFVESGIEAGLIKEINKETIVLLQTDKNLGLINTNATQDKEKSTETYDLPESTDLEQPPERSLDQKQVYTFILKGPDGVHKFYIKDINDFTIIDAILNTVKIKLGIILK